ncbi:MAG: exo-alpha-sialidase, partial [Promethearchaeota archaeon]
NYTVKKGMIQPSVVQLKNGELLCLNRSRTGWIVEMRSLHNGVSWSNPRFTSLPNPNSNVCLIHRRKGDLLLIYNPTKRNRTPLSIARSVDDGKTWSRLFDLQAGNGEFSYPCLCETRDGLVHATYTYQRKTISHDVFWID